MTVATSLAVEEIGAYLRDKLGGQVLDVHDAYGHAVVTIEPETLEKAARLCKSDPRLGFDFFDFLSAIDIGDQGFAVIVHLYSLEHRHHVTLKAVTQGSREAPTMPSITGVYRGANWHEREMYDMFGITFEGHPGLLPRILNVENFEGWPLRKEFHLSTRDAKPWPGAKEPEERKETEAGQAVTTVGNAQPLSAAQKEAAISAKAAAAPEPDGQAERAEVEMDQAVYDQLIAEGKSERIARARAKAATMRARKSSDTVPAAAEETGGGDTDGAAAAQVRTAAGDPEPASPEGAAEVAQTAIAMDAAAGAVGGDVAAGAPSDQPGSDTPVEDLEHEVRVGTGAPPVGSGAPGPEAEGRHTGAVEQSGDKPAAETPGMDGGPPTPSERDPGETPAPGPGSDVSPGPDRPGVAPHADQDVPVSAAPGAEAAPLASDDVPQASGDRPAESSLVHENATEPAPAEGTDAADRGGPLYGATGSANESDQMRPRPADTDADTDADTSPEDVDR